MSRTCTKCLRDLPIERFYRRSDDRNGGHFSRCRDCENARSRAKYRQDLEAEHLKARLKNLRLKQRILDHYGRTCRCCGESEEIFLAIDHINGGGSRHRREVKLGSGSFYSWLVKQGFPDDYQTLCHNCNWAKSHGGCPHRLLEVVEG